MVFSAKNLSLNREDAKGAKEDFWLACSDFPGKRQNQNGPSPSGG